MHSLMFTVAPKIDRRNLKNITVHEGEPIMLDIKVAGEPAPDINWTFGNKSIGPIHEHYSIKIVPYNTTFVIKKTLRKDTGIYTITATNKFGRDEAEFELNVLSKISNCT